MILQLEVQVGRAYAGRDFAKARLLVLRYGEEMFVLGRCRITKTPSRPEEVNRRNAVSSTRVSCEFWNEYYSIIILVSLCPTSPLLT